MLRVVYVQNDLAAGQELLASYTGYVASVHACLMRAAANSSEQGWDQFMDAHYGVLDETRPLDDYYYDLLAANVTFHAHAKSTGYDTLHVVGPAATSVEINGYFSDSLGARFQAFDYCTWDTEPTASIPPDLMHCNL